MFKSTPNVFVARLPKSILAARCRRGGIASIVVQAGQVKDSSMIYSSNIPPSPTLPESYIHPSSTPPSPVSLASATPARHSPWHPPDDEARELPTNRIIRRAIRCTGDGTWGVPNGLGGLGIFGDQPIKGDFAFVVLNPFLAVGMGRMTGWVAEQSLLLVDDGHGGLRGVSWMEMG